MNAMRISGAHGAAATFIALMARSPIARADPAPPPRGYAVEHYQVELRIDAAAKRLDGRERVRVRAVSGPISALRFPRNGLAIAKVRGAKNRDLAFVATGDALEITLDPPLARGRAAAVDVEYTASSPKGVVFDAGAVYTIFHTCHWMVCHEEPGERATFDLAVVAAKDTEVVASGVPVSKKAKPDGLERHAWRQRAPYPTYLFGFATGPFRRVTERGRPNLEHYAPRELTDEAVRTLFAPTRSMLDFFRDRAGVRFPQRVYRQVAVEGDAAQEVSSFAILGRRSLEARLQDPQEDWLIAHELAHQYWGNLITCADWTHFWLNEGLTTFLVAAYKEQRWGREAYDRELAIWRRRHASATEAGFDVPLTFAGEYPSLRVKRAVVYSKGALFLDALRTAVGDRTFWAALRRYTRAFTGRSVTSRDFQQAFERESGRDLADLFETWVYGKR
jgi:aminopeptidase N